MHIRPTHDPHPLNTTENRKLLQIYLGIASPSIDIPTKIQTETSLFMDLFRIRISTQSFSLIVNTNINQLEHLENLIYTHIEI